VAIFGPGDKYPLGAVAPRPANERAEKRCKQPGK
jgi:hypothetical protein